MSEPRPTLRYSLAALAAIAVVALGARLGAQIGALNAVRSDLADAQHNAEDLKAQAAVALGPPLLDAKLSGPADQLRQQLAGLGVAVQAPRIAAVSPAGRGLSIARFVAEGRADAAALDRLSLWAQANPRSVILEGLTATAGPDGRSDVRIELDALVRGAVAAPAAAP
jgi:hypothetical protein